MWFILWLLHLMKTNATFKEITGEETLYVRPSYGSWDKSFEELNMFPVLWIIDPLDWSCGSADRVIERILDKAGIFINEGSFIPETIEAALTNGYKAPYYRNAFLGAAMVNLYMIDTNSMGIQRIYNIQKEKCFPLPTYDLEQLNRVSVTLYGKVLNENYSQLLYTNDTLDLITVFLLDKIQKRAVLLNM